ncbi:MAG TPA: helix-turn-helix transcriptional regulator [Puia sp.]|nr:helix-turn-helix transcriptional regulator [Puia sp.]
MKKKKTTDRPVAEELSAAEIEKILAKIGKLLHSKRKERTTMESFAYEINVSRSAMTRYEAGGDMYLSTLLKLLHGLEISPEEFFKDL